MLDGCRVLVVEDEFMVAQEMKHGLTEAGAVVLGPEPSVELALARIGREARIDAAILDVNLGGERVFPVADALATQQVPFLFATGYEDSMVRKHYPNVTKCDKPIDPRKLVRALKQLIGRDRG